MMVFTMAIIPRKACSCLVDLAVSVQLNTGFIWICGASLYICWVFPFQCQSTCFFLKGKDNTNHTNHLDDNLQFPKSLGNPSFLKWLRINTYWIRYHAWHIMQLPVSHVDQEEYEENPTSLAIIYQVCHLINHHIYIHIYIYIYCCLNHHFSRVSWC